MHTNYRWIGLGVATVLLLGAGIVLWSTARRATPRPPQLAAEVESLGQFPRQPATQGVCAAFPVDLNGDGETEVVAVFGKVNFSKGEPSVWTNLRGEFRPLPICAFYDTESAGRDALPELALEPPPMLLQRELIGWNPQTQQIVRLQSLTPLRMEPIGNLRAERYGWGEMIDHDLNGELDTLVVEFHRQKVAFHLDAQGRWQLVETPLPAPSEVVNQLARKVSSVASNPTGGAVTTTPASFYYQKPRPFVPLLDSDGDGKPERLNVLNREIQFSSGRTVSFPHPFSPGEQFLIAELDGSAPKELVYICLDSSGIKARVYHLEPDKLTLRCEQSLLHTSYAAFATHDFDGDGREELISSQVRRESALWHMWRYDGAKFNPTTETHRTLLEEPDTVRRVLAGRKTFAASTTHRPTQRSMSLQPVASYKMPAVQVGVSEVAGDMRQATVLAGLPDDAPHADLKRWKVTAVDGRVLWYGDYDNDGNEEYALTRPEGTVIAQFRDGKWRVKDLARNTPLVAAFPARRDGKPCLILVYQNGVIEAVRVGR